MSAKALVLVCLLTAVAVQCVQDGGLNVTVVATYTLPLGIVLGKNEYQAGSQLNLSCQAMGGKGTVSYAWTYSCTRDCFFMYSKETAQNVSTMDRGNPFENYLRSTDTGSFNCVAQDSSGNFGAAFGEINVVGVSAFAQENSKGPRFVPNNGLVMPDLSSGTGYFLRVQCVSGTSRCEMNAGTFIDVEGMPWPDNYGNGALEVTYDVPYSGRYYFSNQDTDYPIDYMTQGVYTCQMYDEKGKLHDYNIGIYPCDPTPKLHSDSNSGVYPCTFNTTPSVTSVTFNATTNSVTCVSTGSVPTTVIWTKDGVEITADNQKYKVTQNVTDRADSTYDNVLTFEGANKDMAGTYGCIVYNILGSSNEMKTTVTFSQSSAPALIWNPQSDSAVHVSWRKPSNPARHVLGYSVIVKDHEGDQIYASSVSTDTLSAQISGPFLQAGVAYTVEIVAMCDTGYESIADITDFTRELSPSAAPTGVTVERVLNSGIKVSWDPLPLQTARGRVLFYTVYYKVIGDCIPTRNITVPGSNTSVLIPGLDSCTVKHFVVVVSATTGGGEGPGSAMMEDSSAPKFCHIWDIILVTTVSSVMIALALVLVIVGTVVIVKTYMKYYCDREEINTTCKHAVNPYFEP